MSSTDVLCKCGRPLWNNSSFCYGCNRYPQSCDCEALPT
jgi:hypothetical protein